MAANDKMATVEGVAITSGTTQSFTIPGFGTPTCAIFIISGTSGGGRQGAGSRTSVGFTDGTNEYCTACRGRNDTNNEQTDKIWSNASSGWIISLDANAANNNADFSFSQWVTDGVEITWNNNAASTFFIQVILIQCANAQVGTFTTSATQDAATTVSMSPTFAPQTVFIVHDDTAAVSESHETDFDINFGIADYNGSTIEQACISYHVPDGSSTGDPNARISDVRVSEHPVNTVGFSLESFDADSFDAVTRLAATATSDVGYLSIEWNSVDRKVAIHDAPTGTATVDKSFTWPGFRPQSVIVGLTDLTAIGSASNSTARGMSVCSFNSDDELTTGWGHTDASAKSETSVFRQQGSGGLRLQQTPISDRFIASFANGSFDATGYTLEFTTIPSSGTRKWLGFALQEEGKSQAWPSPTKQMAHLLLR